MKNRDNQPLIIEDKYKEITKGNCNIKTQIEKKKFFHITVDM